MFPVKLFGNITLIVPRLFFGLFLNPPLPSLRSISPSQPAPLSAGAAAAEATSGGTTVPSGRTNQLVGMLNGKTETL
jgi:hypothetical protein